MQAQNPNPEVAEVEESLKLFKYINVCAKILMEIHLKLEETQMPTLILTLEEKVIRVDPLGTMNICLKCPIYRTQRYFLGQGTNIWR